MYIGKHQKDGYAGGYDRNFFIVVITGLRHEVVPVLRLAEILHMSRTNFGERERQYGKQSAWIWGLRCLTQADRVYRYNPSGWDVHVR